MADGIHAIEITELPGRKRPVVIAFAFKTGKGGTYQEYAGHAVCKDGASAEALKTALASLIDSAYLAGVRDGAARGNAI
ncbi:MAG: hypothetical protein J6V72_03770 [Kiritimatiellae bacterium]|nr:hypothetical protein [Kiritimatiellia bacterium]